MIDRLSKWVTAFLIRERSISEENAEIYQYGVEITLSSIFNIVLIMLVSIFAKSIPSGMIFLILFITLRQFSGGYHATTYFRCNTIFLLTYVFVLLMSRYVVISFWANCIFVLLGIMGLLLFAPVPNVHKPLTRDACKRHKRNAIVIYVLFSLIELLLFEAVPYYSRVLFFTLMAIMMLIIFEIFMQRSGLHEVTKNGC